MEILFTALYFAVPLLLYGLIGKIIEVRHFASLDRREKSLAHIKLVASRRVREKGSVQHMGLARGSVVVSPDYLKTFLAHLKGLVGGRLKSYESVMDRARREALIRLRQEALNRGGDMVACVRLETIRLAGGEQRGTAGVEILAYGTVVRRG